MFVDSFPAADAVILNTHAEAIEAFDALGLADRYMEVVTAGAPQKVSHYLELAYANSTDLPPGVIAAAADIGVYAASMGYYGLGVDGRGAKMVAVLRGETVEDAPAVDGRFLPPVADASSVQEG